MGGRLFGPRPCTTIRLTTLFAVARSNATPTANAIGTYRPPASIGRILIVLIMRLAGQQIGISTGETEWPIV
uniref:Putative secreted protein n=1 Tax=Anopheles darlingi TaxID=43151 RepID=A0A2M4D5U4_ANODA